MKNIFIFVILFIFISAFSYANPVNIVRIKADNIIYYKKTNSYSASGNCLIYNDEYSIKSDEASFNKDTSIANLKGNILLEDKDGNWVKGTNSTINVSNYKGFIDNAVMFLKKNAIYIRAKRIILSSRNKYYIYKGTLTGCKCQNFIKGSKDAKPKWSIEAKHTYIIRNDYILSYPVIFKVRKVPLLFLPAIEKDLHTKRKTGFLYPAMGYSSKDGFKYEQPFFININDSQDITLTPFANGRNGYGLKSEYRFFWTKNTKGKWSFTLFKEKRAYGDSKDKKLRATLKANQYFNTDKYGTLKYDINIINNKDNLRVLNKDNIELSSDRYTKSTASYFISKDEYSFGINGYYYQDVIADNNRKTLQTLPEVTFNIVNKKMWENLTLDFSNTAKNNFRIEGERGYSNLSSGFLYYPFKVSYFSITPKIGAHELYAYWKNAPYNTHFSERAFIPEYSIEAKTAINGIFLTQNKTGLLGVKHTITPSLSYKYIPDRNQKPFPDFISTYSKTNALTMALENRIVTKNRNNNTIKYRELFYNKISQDYDFAKTNHFSFPPIYEETRFSPFEHIEFSSKAHLSTQKNIFTDSDESLNITRDSAGIGIGYLMSRDSNSLKISDESAKARLYIYPIKKLYTYVYIEKSLYNHYYPTKKIGFMYNEDCWGIGTDIYINQIPEEKNGIYTRKKNVGFWITLVLKGIGEVKRQY